MPAEFTPLERIAKLETWCEERIRQDNLEHQKRQGSLNRRFIIIAALIGLFAVVGAAALSAWLISLLSN